MTLRLTAGQSAIAHGRGAPIYAKEWVVAMAWELLLLVAGVGVGMGIRAFFKRK